MKTRKNKFIICRLTLLTAIALMAVTFLSVPNASTQDKDVLTTFIEEKLSENLDQSHSIEIQRVAKSITDGSRLTKLDALLILAIIEHESMYQVDAIGRHGEIGLLQVRPETAEWILKRNNRIWLGKEMLFDPKNNVGIGILYLAWLNSKFNNAQATLAAYNMGPYATQKHLNRKIIPKIYYNKVLAKYQNLLAEFDSYQIALNPNAKPSRLTASNY